MCVKSFLSILRTLLLVVFVITHWKRAKRNLKEYDLLCLQAKIQTILGQARFTDDSEPTVEVNGKKYTAPHILIATGGQPSVMSDNEVPGIRHCSQVYLSTFLSEQCSLITIMFYSSLQGQV